MAHPGEFCGVLSALTGEPSFFTLMAGQDSYLLAITKTSLYQCVGCASRTRATTDGSTLVVVTSLCVCVQHHV